MGKYFSIAELTRSDVAAAKGIDNTPPPHIEARLNLLIDNLLDSVRELWGGPLRVNSGYRCRSLNAAVGGAPDSQHMRGEAADITAGNRDANRKLFQLIAECGVEFDQLIDEKNYTWLHISYSAPNNRKQILHL